MDPRNDKRYGHHCTALIRFFKKVRLIFAPMVLIISLCVYKIFNKYLKLLKLYTVRTKKRQIYAAKIIHLKMLLFFKMRNLVFSEFITYRAYNFSRAFWIKTYID